MRVRTTIQQSGKTATGIEDPADVVEAMGVEGVDERDNRRNSKQHGE